MITKRSLLLLFISAQISSALFCSSAETVDVVQDVSTIMLSIQTIPTHVTDLPVSDFVVAALCGFVGATAGHLTTCAIAHLVDQNTTIKPSLFTPSEWNKYLTIATLGSGALAGGSYLAICGPKLLAKQVNQPLLVAVITAKDSNSLKQTLAMMFVTHKFPRARAFQELLTLQNYLSALLEAFGKLKGKKGEAQARVVAPAILSFLQETRHAMLSLKNDPRWFEECNAATLAMTGAAIESQGNAQLAAGVIQLAHRR